MAGTECKHEKAITELATASKGPLWGCWVTWNSSLKHRASGWEGEPCSCHCSLSNLLPASLKCHFYRAESISHILYFPLHLRSRTLKAIFFGSHFMGFKVYNSGDFTYLLYLTRKLPIFKSRTCNENGQEILASKPETVKSTNSILGALYPRRLNVTGFRVCVRMACN